MDETRRRIMKNIADEIKQSGKNQSEIARELGVARSVINDYVCGQSVPTVFSLIKLCEVLGCTSTDILGV